MRRLPSLLVTGFLWLAAADTVAAPLCNADEKANQALHQHAYAPIGGIDQWLVIDGTSCANPVILFVHGGPGNPLSPVLDSLYGAWTKDFTLATWDQRLSGRTYARNEQVTELTEERIEATDLTIERLVADGIEAAEYLQRTLGARRLILTGTSWGSVLAVHMAKKRPDLFHAYVGVSQLVSDGENLVAAYSATLDMAHRKQDAPAIKTLEELGSPPWMNPRNFGRMRRIIRAYEAELTTTAAALQIAPEYASDGDRAAYEAGEELSFIKYVGLKGDGLARSIDLPRLGTTFEVPMFFIQGEEDLLTRPVVTRVYVQKIRAPRKELVMVPKAGHDPNLAMIEAQLRLIKSEIVPRMH